MNENETKLASEVIHEQKVANKRMFVILMVVLAMFFVSNLAWLVAWNLPNYKSETITIDSEAGNANYIGNDGDITNGENKDSKGNQDEQSSIETTDTQKTD